MSLIRQALKKAADETESPPPLTSDAGTGGNKSGSFPLKKIGLVVLLLIVLSGVLVYSFFPEQPALYKNSLVLRPQYQLAKKIEIKPPAPAPVQEKEYAQQIVPGKIEAKSPQPLPDQVKKPPEQGPVKKSEGISKAVPTHDLSVRDRRPGSFAGLMRQRNQSSKPNRQAKFLNHPRPRPQRKNRTPFRWFVYLTRRFEIRIRACFLKPSSPIRKYCSFAPIIGKLIII